MNRRYLILLVLVFALAAGGYYFFQTHRQYDDPVAEKQKYICPMHPQIIQDKPGDCPICGMKLVPQKMDETEKEGQPAAKRRTMYRSTMSPNEISDKPGKDSMGMEMVPFEPEEEGISTPSGLAAVKVSQEKRDLLGISFSPVSMKRISREIRTSARIVADETRRFQITSKAEGWVERLFVNQTGQYVRKGEALMAIYSPELVSAQQEYISAAAIGVLSTPPDSTRMASLKELESAAREKLRLFDISDAQIDRLHASGKVERTMTLNSPVSGYLTEKMVLQGKRIMMNDPLMTIDDLSRIWGEVDIYESDLPYVKVGMPAELTLSYWPGKSFPGHITFLAPFLDTETRTLKARIELGNPGLVLKPGMYADVKLAYDLGELLTVPESAVMRTGVREYVFIQGENDLIVPREIKVGAYSGEGDYEVVSGLQDGEFVLTSANFLIDSESSLKAALKSAADAGSH